MPPRQLTITLLLALRSFASFGQFGAPDSVRISGGPCTNSALSITSPIPANQITWMLNGTMVVSQQTAAQTASTTVAGGNGQGSAANQLDQPDRIFVDPYGNVYIPDRNNLRVQEWAPGATSGVTVAGGNGSGDGANQIEQPTAVTVDKTGNVYVCDQFNSRILKWAPGATSGITVATYQELDVPTDIFMDVLGYFYVSNQGSGTVLKFSADFSSYTIVAGINNYMGSALTQLSSPTGIFVDAQGNIYICDTGNNRVMKWAPDGTSGVVVAGGNGYGNASNQLANPLGVTVDCQGNMYIADTYNNRIQLWAPGAASATTIMGSGSAADQVSVPANVFLDGDNYVYISDAGNNRVQRYGSTINRSYTPSIGGTYTATVNTGCGTVTSNAITVYNAGPPALQPDTTICPGATIRLDAQPGYLSYLWQDGSTDSVFTASGPGTYIVKVTSLCGGPYSDTVTVSPDKIPARFLPPDTAVCSYDTLLLQSAAKFSEYLWSDGSAGATTVVNHPGLYWLQGTDQYGCMVTDSVLVSSTACPPEGVYVPSAFTPNGDGRNDVFRPKAYGPVTNYSFAVYSRWGQLVFSSKDPGAGWDGRVGGQLAESNTFAWYCSYQLSGKPLTLQKGTVLLLR